MRLKRLEKYFNRHINIKKCPTCWEYFANNVGQPCPQAMDRSKRILQRSYWTSRVLGWVSAPFLWIDHTLLGWATRFSHWLQRLCGITCYAIARVGTLLALTSLTMRAVNYFVPFLKVESHLGMLTFLALIWVPQLLANIRFTHKSEAHLWESRSLLNTAPYSALFLRLLWVSVTPLNYVLVTQRYYHDNLWINGLAVSFDFGMAIFTYFIAVVPLPPGPTKVGQFLQSFKQRRFAPQENP